MGIPKFFRYIAERYPSVLEPIRGQFLDYDYLYIDVNGLLHTSAYSENELTPRSESEIFRNVFTLIEELYTIIKPRKVLYLAVDGVAPRAKMNQQRARRFLNVKEQKLQERELQEKGVEIQESINSSAISVGTELMEEFDKILEYFVTSRLSHYPHWQNCKVILSGEQVPGEGEHKIMDYIRYMKSQPDYDPFAKHCFYGLDADLIILGMVTHEINFSILREEIKYGNKVQIGNFSYHLLQLSLLREYLDMEFSEVKDKLPFEYNLDCIIDDWVLMGFFLGNDFLPHLPFLHIDKEGIEILYNVYIEVLPTLTGYINEGGYLNLSRLQTFLERLAKHELECFAEAHSLAALEDEMLGDFDPELDKDADSPKDSELEKLIAATNEALGLDDEKDIEDLAKYDEETLRKEFFQHKRDYYMTKLEFTEMTEDLMLSQAEGYVRALQWVLHYYYHGCRSWNWYYPHHYAPFVSDIVNFQNANLNFDLGHPFTPFQHLMAIMPPERASLVPAAYRDLMTSDDSPIKYFYPNDFEVDLNGKRQQWEGVVLIPFVNEDELLEAMKPYDQLLTDEEIRKNQLRDILIYTYVGDDLGIYKTPFEVCGPDVQPNHASVTSVPYTYFYVDVKQVKICKPKLDPDVYFLGFPSLKTRDFKWKKTKGKVKLFFAESKNKSITLSITQNETPDVMAVAKKLLGKQVYVNWPFLTEARVSAISNREKKFTLNGETIECKLLSSKAVNNFKNEVSSIDQQYMQKQGIGIDKTEILVHTKDFKGFKKAVEASGKVSIQKVWSTSIKLHPLQTVVEKLNLFEDYRPFEYAETEKSIDGSTVFMLGFPFYGCMGRITYGDEKRRGDRIPVRFEVPSEPKLDKEVLEQLGNQYHSLSVASSKVGVMPRVLSRIAGSIYLSYDQDFDGCEPINIGLQIKENKRNEIVPGYTRKTVEWNYSDKAIDLMKEYVEKYSNVVEVLTNKPGFPYWSDYFPGPDGGVELIKMLEWLDSLEIDSIPRCSCGSQILDKEIVMEMEKIIDSSPKEITIKNILVKPQLLYKPDFISTNLAPVATTDHQLFDRVISAQPYTRIPLGLRGYIIGIVRGETQEDFMYDILYDEPIGSEMKLNCSPRRGCRTSSSSFINITHGERVYHMSKVFAELKVDHTEQKAPNPSTTAARGRTSSAFVQWNNYPPAPLYTDKAEQFKALWSYLEKANSQQKTNVLKKILKIEDGETQSKIEAEEKPPKIEDNVKTFFENISKSAESMRNALPELDNVKLVLQQQQHCDNIYRQRLANYFTTRNLPLPIYQTIRFGDKFVSQVLLHDCRAFTGFPCAENEAAAESAAQNALHGLGELDLDFFSRTEKERTRRIIENQNKLEKALLKSTEAGTKQKNGSASNSKPVIDKESENGQSPRPNHMGNHVPLRLPTPPAQWCKQYKNSVDANAEEQRPDSSKSERSKRSIYKFNNGRPRADSEGGNEKVGHNNWRQEERAKNQQCDIRNNKDEKSKNWRYRPGIIDAEASVSLRPESTLGKQGRCKDAVNNSQVEACQKTSAIAAEFIPLQALTRCRNRGNVQTTAFKKVKDSEKVVQPPKSPAKPVPKSFQKTTTTPFTKPTRKSKIAAKFDAEWDLLG